MRVSRLSVVALKGHLIKSVAVGVLLFGFTTVSANENATSWPDERVKALIDGLDAGKLKTSLQSCEFAKPEKTDFSIAHRGAPLYYPEHTREGYIAAAEMGAGIVECDVTFTKDKTLVCRHSQCDLHTSTNILETELAAKCSVPPDAGSSQPYSSVQCCTSDLTQAEFKTLQGKKDYGNKKADNLKDYMFKEADTGGDYPTYGTLMTHAESIALFESLAVNMIPELKAPQVTMPFDGFTQEDYAQALVDEYKAANISPEKVTLQSFNLDDVKFWIANTPEYAAKAAWLDGRYRDKRFNVGKPASWKPSMQELADAGLATLAPPLWMLLDLDGSTIVPSVYAEQAKAAGLKLVPWTLERSGPLNRGGGWYYQSVGKVINKDSDTLRVLDVMAREVGIVGIFSDWPATTTYYANCLKE